MAGLSGPVLAEREREVGGARRGGGGEEREGDKKLCDCPIGPPRGAFRLSKG